jgi:hypothetical protein
MVAALAALVLGGAGEAAAQARGLPVYNSGVPRGIGLAAEFGKPNDAAGGGTAFGVRALAGFGPIGATAIVSRHDPGGEGDNVWSAGATANLKLIGGPLIPLSVTLQGGAGYTKASLDCLPLGSCAEPTEWRFPIGLGIGLNIPNPALAIRPWIAPRVDVVRVSSTGVTTTDANFGISGGVEFNLLTGLGLHVAYDWSKVGSLRPGVFGAGLHYAFRVPGL